MTAALRDPYLVLSTEEERRAVCLALALDLVAGRSVPIAYVWRLARWLYNGQTEEADQ